MAHIFSLTSLQHLLSSVNESPIRTLSAFTVCTRNCLPPNQLPPVSRGWPKGTSSWGTHGHFDLCPPIIKELSHLLITSGGSPRPANFWLKTPQDRPLPPHLLHNSKGFTTCHINDWAACHPLLQTRCPHGCHRYHCKVHRGHVRVNAE